VDPSRIFLLRGDRPLLLAPRAVAEDVGGAPAGPWTDLRALADVARFCISGMAPTADGQPVEPTARIVERLIFDDRAVRYGQEFMRVLDAAASPDVAQRPQSVAEFRDRLRQAAHLDAWPGAADTPTPTAARPPGSGQSASDDAVEIMIKRVIDAIPPRTPAKPRPLRRDPTLEPSALSRRPATDPAIEHAGLPTTRIATPPRRRTWLGARVLGVVLAVVGFGAWQWLYRPMPTDVAPALPEVATAASAALPSPAPVIAAQPLEAAPPVVDTVASSAAIESALPVEATPVEPKSVPVEQRAIQPAPVRSPREACGERTQFSLYLCMQQQCARAAWTNHPQCVRFRDTDQVD
jgi:hypothetical protein